MTGTETTDLTDYEWGFRDAQELAAQKMAGVYEKFQQRCSETEVGRFAYGQ